MIFLNGWILFGLIPLFFLYKKQTQKENSRQTKLLYLSLLFMIIAVAQPALKNALHNEKFDSQDYIIAIDASYSMQADDLKPSRFAVAKEGIKKLFKLHPKDRFTLFAFTSKALLIAPPTTDTAISSSALDALNPRYILTKSTSLKNLFQTVAKSSFKQKKLIIFSDGGDEHNVASLVSLLKKNNIIPYFVATASQKGAALKKDGSYIKDANGALVISKINPSLKAIAADSGGKYYELNSLGVIEQLSNDITTNTTDKNINIKVQSYKELFYIPLSIALILFFISVTKLHQLFVLIPLLLLFPYKANAGILDFYYLKKANSAYKEKHYLQSARAFDDMSPSFQSYFNAGTAYYKAHQYHTALKYFSLLKTPDKRLKALVYYDIANCAVHLKQYKRAQKYYMASLALHKDKDALYNLNLLRKLHLFTLPSPPNALDDKKPKKEKKQIKEKAKHSKENNKNKANGNSSNQNAQLSKNGAAENKKKHKSGARKKKKEKSQASYKMGYKAYELINKGYTNEKEPW